MWIILRKTFEKTVARYDTIEHRIQQIEGGEIKFNDDPRDQEAVKERKLAVLGKQKDESSKEIETLLLTAIEVCSNSTVINVILIIIFIGLFSIT